MGNIKSQLSREDHQKVRTNYERKRKQRMDNEQNNDYFKDEKIINDGKKKKKEMKLKYHALMTSLS